jgi:hypothetical protein
MFTSTNVLVELQRKSIALERASIVRFLRNRAGERIDPAELADLIEHSVHQYDGELFKEPPCPQPTPTPATTARPPR